MQTHFDVIIAGSGHNALVAACYLARAGRSVLILEKNDYVGGATTSQRTFPEYEARLSRYSYLISLFPNKIREDLGLELSLLTRKTASYTPYEQDGIQKGLLLSNADTGISKDSVLHLGHGVKEWEGYLGFLNKCERFARLVWDSMLLPLQSAESWKARFESEGEGELWEDFVERPIGELIEKQVKSEVLRGVLLTDARIGAFTWAHDPSLLQNKTFLYHVIGNKTGEWKVPKGGMGELVGQLKKLAESYGVQILTNHEVMKIDLLPEGVRVNDSFFGKKLLWNAAVPILQKLLPGDRLPQSPIGEGTAFKINILLKKLPELKDPSVSPEDTFCGTFHINQSYSRQQKAFEQASSGGIPEVFPCEMYCHTLTDPSILSPDLQEKGFQTITVFGLDMPYRLFEKENEKQKERVLSKFYEGINHFLKEPIQECIARNADGSLCLECKSAADLERELGMPQGNIFHSELSWFFAENPSEVGQWGVETGMKNIILCGSGARRGGAVSGIPGYLAAKKVLES